MHGIGNQVPVVDESQDVELLDWNVDDGILSVRLRRKWNTCDKHDFVIGVRLQIYMHMQLILRGVIAVGSVHCNVNEI